MSNYTMADYEEAAKQYLIKVCGNMVSPDASSIVESSYRYLANNIIMPTKNNNQEANWNNESLACLCRNIFIAGYEEGIKQQ